MPPTPPTNLLPAVADAVRRADVFDDVQIDETGQLICAARQVDAEYAVAFEPPDHRPWVILRSSDRWLSESIEADLMHSGDKLEELIAEELLEFDHEFPIRFEHFRDEHKRYVFRTPTPLDPNADQLVALLLAYEAAFRQLGDMGGEADD